MDKKTLEARIRQIMAIDKNALLVYTDLAKSVDDGGLKDLFSKIAKDEERHVALGAEMLSLVEK